MEEALANEEAVILEVNLPTEEASTSRDPPKKTKKDRLFWREVADDNDIWEIPEWLGSIEVEPENQSISTLLSYFRKFFTDDLLSLIVDQSNLYASQVNVNKPLNLTVNELEQWLGILLYMSVVKLPQSRFYWNKIFNCTFVTNVMSRNRFEEIKKCIHFSDNSKAPKRDEEGFDKLYKIRPLLDKIRACFNAIPMDNFLSVDEQIIPFKGTSCIKQYMPSKPNKWGYKFFVMCDSKGIIYDILPYTGQTNPVENCPDLGASSNVVVYLTQIVPDSKNFVVVFDNWFSSVALLKYLKGRSIYSVGTVRINRLPGINATMKSDKTLEKNGRGSFQELETSIDNIKLRAVKWFDNRAVTLISSCISANPTTSCRRYDKKEKKMIDVTMPNTVNVYNKHMGGVDLVDGLVALYRIVTRSKKWYHRLFFHMIDLSIVNAWGLYRRDANSMAIEKKHQHKLYEFRLMLANALIMSGKAVDGGKKRGRPSSIDNDFNKKRKLGPNTRPIPTKDIRLDNVGHNLVFRGQRGACKKPGCTGKTNHFCTKCQVHLCCNSQRNCNLVFHTE